MEYFFVPIRYKGERMKIVKPIMKVLMCLVYVFIFGMILFVAVVLVFRWKLYCVQTGSMEPTLPVGSMIVVEKVDFDHLQEGDIITFTTGENTVVTHRLTEIDRNTQLLTTKGDKNNVADAPVSYGHVIGRVKFFVPGIGKAVLLLDTRFGKLMLGIIAFALIGILVIKRIYYHSSDDEGAEGEKLPEDQAEGDLHQPPGEESSPEQSETAEENDMTEQADGLRQ